MQGAIRPAPLALYSPPLPRLFPLLVALALMMLFAVGGCGGDSAPAPRQRKPIPTLTPTATPTSTPRVAGAYLLNGFEHLE